MTALVRNWQWACAGGVIALLLAAAVYAADAPGRPAKIGGYDPQAQTVEMFAAIKKGDIAVKLIPKDSTQCTVQIENKTDKPLNVKLPEAFAGVPVLAPIPPGGGAARGSGRNGSNGGNRGAPGMGGGMGGGGMGGMGGQGMFNVPPEKVGKFVVPTVCLEHGKREPRASIPYEIKPLESLTTKPGVRELCEMVGRGKVNQRAAQAAAWHLNNDMTWQELAAKKVHHTGGRTEPYFSPAEIQAGMQIATAAVKTAEEQQKKDAAPGSSASRKNG
jgi:hypothetical protein